MEPLSLTLRGAHSETMTKGCPLVVPWLGLVQNVSPCAAWDLQQQIQNQIPLGSGTLGTQGRHRWTLHQAYSLRHLSPWGEPRASLLAGKHGAGEEGNARPSCTRGGAGMPMGTACAGDREQRHTRAWTQRHDSPRPRETARSPECHPPSLACTGWDVSLPQTPRQGLSLGLCPRGPATFAPLLLLVATTSPPNISTVPASCDLPRSNPSNCPASSTAFRQTLSHFS